MIRPVTSWAAPVNFLILVIAGYGALRYYTLMPSADLIAAEQPSPAIGDGATGAVPKLQINDLDHRSAPQFADQNPVWPVQHPAKSWGSSVPQRTGLPSALGNRSHRSAAGRDLQPMVHGAMPDNGVVAPQAGHHY